MSQPAHQFSASNLACERGDRLLFENLGFELGSGQALMVNGDNGSGKTSLLRLLCGLNLPDEGEIYWNGRSIERSAGSFRRELCYIGHKHGVKNELSVTENIGIASGLQGQLPGDQTESLLQQVGLSPSLAEQNGSTLSAGQARRVALTRLLTTPATLWILDEPFTALDAGGRDLVENLLARHIGNGGMAVLTSHHPVSIHDVEPLQLELS